ncbi:MAG: hypothetical protein JXA11_06340 [Phycisphaerae bacterium]|nr:hypothetical protein [Phycisphaerae bacterium]
MTMPMTALGNSATSINVKDFGAIGDGVADDTDAIQKAVVAAMKSDTSPSVRIRKGRPHPNHERRRGVELPLLPEVVFPEGTYRITRPIVFVNYAHVRGVGKCVIQQSNPNQDIFYFAADVDSFRTQSIHFMLRGLQFEGGKTQIRIWPQNINAALAFIEDCRFVNSADYAVVCTMYGKAGWSSQRIIDERDGKPLDPGELYWPPFVIEWKDHLPDLHPNKIKRGDPIANSTLLRIVNCTFDRCMGVADISPDTTYIRDTEVTVHPQMDGPVFNIEYGVTYFYRVKGVASPAPGKHPFWIRGGNRFSVRDCEFDTTTENGIDFIRVWDEQWMSKEKRVPSNFIDVRNTRVKAAGGLSNALVWLGKRCQPNLISLIGVTETSANPVKAITWEAPRELANLKDFRSTLTPDKVNPKTLYKILLARNSRNIKTALPPLAKTMRETPAPETMLAEIAVPEFSWKPRDLWAKVTVSINAADYGVDADPETDDTEALQKLFDAAAQKGACEVVFPAGVYLVSKPIRLPPEVFVRGAGIAAFRQGSLESDIFHAENARMLGFRNVMLVEGRYGIDVTPAKDADARIAFTDCWFTDQAVAVRGMPEGKDNQAEILIDGGYIDSTQAIVSNAKTQVEGFWAFNGSTLENQGFFENHGSMRIQAMLGVPGRLKGNLLLENPRWIDNFGRLEAIDDRFGGEAGGFCNVYNRSRNGTVYITGGVGVAKRAEGKKCILYLEETPKAAVVQAFETAPWTTPPYDGFSIVKDPQGRVKNARVFTAGLLRPKQSD